MISPPKANVFVDGQNLYRSLLEGYGATHPNYDIRKLAKLVSEYYLKWSVEKIHFYTGVPAAKDNKRWNEFWANKFRVMSRDGINLFKRDLRYRTQEFNCPEGHTFEERVGIEKGIDVRIALDIVRTARSKQCEAILIFSQDQDLSEAVKEVKQIAKEQQRHIHIACAFPSGPNCRNGRGIDGAEWVRFTQTDYESCLDLRDYRAKMRAVKIKS